MIYQLERRNSGLAMPTTLYNFLNHNKIEYKYDFDAGGIEITETAMESIRNDYKAFLEQESIKYIAEDKNSFKTQIQASGNKIKTKREKKKLW